MSAPGVNSEAGAAAAGEVNTGHPRIDEALASLTAGTNSPAAEQVKPLAEADRALRETLDSIGDV